MMRRYRSRIRLSILGALLPLLSKKYSMADVAADNENLSCQLCPDEQDVRGVKS